MSSGPFFDGFDVSAVVNSGFSSGVLGTLTVPFGLGLLRLSTEGRPLEDDAVDVVRFALERGVRLLDTADAYALNDRDLHYGERLVRKALGAWGGPREEVRVVTKVGLARPKGRWVPNGTRAHLRRMTLGSLEALEVPRLFLLLLHTVDPKTPLEETLAALAELQREGKVEHLGLSNATVAVVRQAERHFTVRAIENELSVVDRSSAADGLVALARDLGIPFLAHRPLGGHAKTGALVKNRAVKPVAVRHGITAHEAALSALFDLGAPVVPIVGATRRQSVESMFSALRVPFDDVDRAALASRIRFEPTESARKSIVPRVTLPGTPALRVLTAGEGPQNDPEIVMVIGIQGAGKSSEVDRYVARGYARLNRDEVGGQLDGLVPKLEELLSSGQCRVVMDNTYGTRASRFAVLQVAHAQHVPVRGLFLATPLEDAYENVVLRVLERHGALLGPDERKALAKADPNLPPPAALARWAASFEPPSLDEGFSVVETVPFARRIDPSHTNKGLLLDVDGTLRRTKSGDIFPRDPLDIEILPGRREALERAVAAGFALFLVSNQSGVASGTVTRAAVDASFAKTVELLGVPIAEVAYCPHPAFPVGCFCRKPLPGLGVALIRRHRLARDSLVMVGDLASDELFARSIGATYVKAEVFFAP